MYMSKKYKIYACKGTDLKMTIIFLKSSNLKVHYIFEK